MKSLFPDIYNFPAQSPLEFVFGSGGLETVGEEEREKLDEEHLASMMQCASIVEDLVGWQRERENHISKILVVHKFN